MEAALGEWAAVAGRGDEILQREHERLSRRFPALNPARNDEQRGY
jgi:hypothetical protein